MKAWIKEYLFELAAWTIILALVGTGAYSWHKIMSWSEATIDSIELEVSPASAAHPIYTAPAPEPGNAVVVSSPGEPQHVVYDDGLGVWYGTASWYDYSFYGEDVGRPCYREREDCWTEDQLVAASRDYPRGTKLVVRNLNTEESVVVTVTDYGPDEELHPGRIIDLSSYAFSRIADLSEGLIEVWVHKADESDEWLIRGADGGVGYGEDGYYSTN